MKKLIGTEPVALLDRVGTGRPLIQNLGPGKLYFDLDPEVSPSTGFEIAVGGAFEFAEDSDQSSTLYAVADQAGTDVRIINF